MTLLVSNSGKEGVEVTRDLQLRRIYTDLLIYCQLALTWSAQINFEDLGEEN